MQTINEGASAGENDLQNPSALPLPETEVVQLPIPGPSSKAFCSDMTNQPSPQYHASMIPLPILDACANIDDDTGTNQLIDVVSEDPTEGSYTADQYRRGLENDSDEVDDISR